MERTPNRSRPLALVLAVAALGIAGSCASVAGGGRSGAPKPFPFGCPTGQQAVSVGGPNAGPSCTLTYVCTKGACAGIAFNGWLILDPTNKASGSFTGGSQASVNIADCTSAPNAIVCANTPPLPGGKTTGNGSRTSVTFTAKDSVSGETLTVEMSPEKPVVNEGVLSYPWKGTWHDSTGLAGTVSGGVSGGRSTPPVHKVSLAVSVSRAGGARKAKVGDTVKVITKVTARGGTVSSISLGKGLVSSSGAAEVTASPPGLSGFSLGNGASRSFTFSVKALDAGVAKLSAQAAGRTSTGRTVSGSGSTTLRIAGASLLVTVKPTPGELRLDLKGDTLVPRPVKVAVSVKNTGKVPVLGVTLQDKLLISYLDGKPKVPAVPIRPQGLPSPRTLGTIAPGKTVKGTYTVLAKGDGDYELEALAVGSTARGGRVAGTGSGELHVTSPIVVVSTGRGRGASLPDAHGLIISGTPFTIKLRFRNLSYVHKVVIRPFAVGLTGNGFGGQVILAGGPIEPSSGTRPPVPPEFLVLDPQQTLDAEAIVYTSESQGILQNIGRQGVGGTEATVTVPHPGVNLVTDQGKQGEAVPGKDVSIDGETTFRVGIDDRDLYEPQTYKDWLTGDYTGGRITDLAYFSAGMLKGIGNFFSGIVHVIPQIPLLLAKGWIAIPPALYAYTQFEVELWRSLAHDPAAKVAFSNAVTATLYLAYKHAQGFAESDFAKQIVAAEEAYFNNLSNLWARDPGAAIEQVGEVTGEAVAPVAGPKLAAWLVKGLGPGILVRSEPVLKAFAASENKLFTAFGEELTARYPSIARLADAVSALEKAPPGFPFTNTQIRQLFGLTAEQAEWLRDFAKARDLLIVCRSRAVESVAWLRGQVINGVKWAEAVLKPEAIKMKNVSLYDWEYLGYQESDIGRVVISNHELPSVAQVEAKMAANGIARDSTDWKAILERLSQREAEFTDPLGKGTVKDMIEAARAGGATDHGEMTMKFNLAGNSVDPAALATEQTTYPFRLADESGKVIPKKALESYRGSMVPQFFVKGEWRCVTGDVDFLQITKGNGSPLSDLERAAVYRAMASGPVGMLHGESATWTLKGLFSFEKKVHEFERAGTALMFAPDRTARAVMFLREGSEWRDKLNYVIRWAGGDVNPSGAVSP